MTVVLLLTLSKDNSTYNIDVASSQETLYIGDYGYTTTQSGTTYDYTKIIAAGSDSTKAASVNLVVTSGMSIKKLVVNSPSKTVTINGQTLESGKAYKIENLTVEEVSMNTVIIESGMIVDKLIMKKGGLEIHGTVNSAEVASGATTSDIKVRECEGLYAAVYNVLKPYIDVENGYFGELESGKSTYCIRREVVTKIGDTEYYTIAKALDAATDGQTIDIVKDITLNDWVLIQKSVNFNLNNHTVTGAATGGTTHTDYCFTYCAANPDNRISGKVYNGTIICKKVGVYAADYSDITVEDLTITQTTSDGLTPSFPQSALAASDNATLLVKSGTYSADYAAAYIFNSGAYMTIEGGTFSANLSSGSYSIRVDGTQYNQTSNVSVAELKGGIFNGPMLLAQDAAPSAYAAILAKGGTYNVDPSTYLPFGYTANANGTTPETWTVVAPPLFSVSTTKQVQFSKGNLYWDGNAYHFEENQWDFPHVVDFRGDIQSSDYNSNHVGHFYFTKTASVAYASSYNDANKAKDDVLWCAENTPVTVESADGWYALTYNEVGYLLSTRVINGKTGEGNSRQRTTLTLSDNSTTVYGLIIVPDNYNGTPALSATTSWSNWQTMEAAGCIFIPAAGYGRQSGHGNGFDDHGRYWYANGSGSTLYGRNLDFSEYNFTINQCNQFRDTALPIRLVHN